MIFFFLQTGTGHFSPIGGYHAGRDMALILDVARFKYPPHWVPLSNLWEGMNIIDDTTGQHRGYVFTYIFFSVLLYLITVIWICMLEPTCLS